ncbi:MAG TPA: hypothetical protein DEP42_04925 [Ruminococcaceae bacterium]|nr:hypothetical protein [Oscillospiraceae bacterium]
MGKEFGEFVGVDSATVALVTEDSDENYTAGPNEFLAPSAEISAEVSTNTKTTYYDNVPGFNYNTEGVTTITVTVSGVPAKTAAKILGKNYDEESGRVLDDGVLNPPDMALSFRFNKGPSEYRYYQYMKGNFSGGTEDAESKTDDVNEHTYELTYTAVVTTHKWEIDGKNKGLKRIFADTDDENFQQEAADEWFFAVQTPDGPTKSGS